MIKNITILIVNLIMCLSISEIAIKNHNSDVTWAYVLLIPVNFVLASFLEDNK